MDPIRNGLIAGVPGLGGSLESGRAWIARTSRQ